jgi:hypothetical protein
MTTFRIHRSSEWSLPRTVSLTGAIAVHACAIVLLAMPMMRPGTIAAIAEPIQVIWYVPEPVPIPGRGCVVTIRRSASVDCANV